MKGLVINDYFTTNDGTFLIMLIGFYAYKKGFISDEASKKISSIVVNIANPALILSGAVAEGGKATGKELLISVTVAFLVYSMLLIVSMYLPKLIGIDSRDQNVYKAMTVFSNIGFIGFPIIASVFGNSALLYASPFLLPYNLLIYTYGIKMMKKEQTDKKIEWKMIFNIGVIACLLSMVIFYTEITLPRFLVTTINMLSNMTVPLSMIVIGASFGTMHFKKLFMDARLILFSLIKLLVIPIAGTFLILLFVKNQIICGVTMIILATPVGSMTAMLAQEYDGNYELAARGIAVTTILSVLTMPIVSVILKL